MFSNLSNAEILNNLLEGRNLDDLTSRSLMKRWLNDEISDVERGAFLSALRAKSATGVELSSMAEELLNVCELPVARPNLYLVDTCGTGGDGANTFNISTAVAFVAASCGVKIAKHGNKSASGKVGSAFLKSNLLRIKKRLDHAEHGGALLLGVNGICVIGHGSSKSLSVVSALRLAHSAVNHGVMDNLNQLQKLQVLNS